MSIESTVRRFQTLNHAIGKKALNALFPNDFEIYIFAFELVDGDGNTEEYFIFPTNPNSVNDQNNPLQTIKKTAGGMTVLNTTTFSPSDISLQGNFGRKFKFLIGSQLINFSNISFKFSLKNFVPSFNKHIKTGYGCIKVLEDIIKKSNTLDSKGQPYALFFYNLALGNNYLVKTTGYNFYQNPEMNMIWSYNINLRSLIRVEDITGKSQKSLTAVLSANSAIQGAVNAIGNSVGAILPH